MDSIYFQNNMLIKKVYIFNIGLSIKNENPPTVHLLSELINQTFYYNKQQRWSKSWDVLVHYLSGDPFGVATP